MKKYKVLTDNLDWYGIQKGAKITFTDSLEVKVDNILEGGVYPNYYTISENDSFKINMLLDRHKDWFEEIKEKPPLGLMPKYIHIENRLADINNAIDRYDFAGLEVPYEWHEERADLIKGIAINYMNKEYSEEDMIIFGSYIQRIAISPNTNGYDYIELINVKKELKNWKKIQS